MTPKTQVLALTVAYDRLVNALKSKAGIGVAFDPVDPPPVTIEFDAIWDTGATASVITKNAVSKCGLKPIGMAKVHTAKGETTTNKYLVSILLPNGVTFASTQVTEGELYEADVLIGMDVIGRGDFAVSSFQGKTVFSYRFPSMAKTDYVAEVNQLKKSDQPKVGRNDACPCGSGKKYKKCCA